MIYKFSIISIKIPGTFGADTGQADSKTDTEIQGMKNTKKKNLWDPWSKNSNTRKEQRGFLLAKVVLVVMRSQRKISSWRFLCVNSLTIFVYLFLSPFLSVIHITEFNMLEFVGWFSGLCTIYLFSSLFIQSWETYSILSFISSTDFLNPFSYTLVIYFPMVPLFKYYPLLIQLGWYILIFLKTIIKSLENFLCFLHFLSPYYPSFSGMFVLPFVFHVERFPKISLDNWRH